MSDLSKRASKYFLLQGLKLTGYVFLIYGILFLEWILIGSDDEIGVLNFTLQMFLLIGGFFSILMNVIFSMYGPNWYDGLALSMGARRKDVFLGEFIKQGVFVLCHFAVLMGVAIIFKKDMYKEYILFTSFLSFVLGPLGLIIGYSIRKYGKIIIFVIAIASGLCGAWGSIAITSGTFAVNFQNLNAYVIAVVGLIIFAGLEFVVYKLNQKSMVR